MTATAYVSQLKLFGFKVSVGQVQAPRGVRIIHDGPSDEISELTDLARELGLEVERVLPGRMVVSGFGPNR